MSVFLHQFVGVLFMISGFIMIATAGGIVMYRRDMTTLDMAASTMLVVGGLITLGVGAWMF